MPSVPPVGIAPVDDALGLALRAEGGDGLGADVGEPRVSEEAQQVPVRRLPCPPRLGVEASIGRVGSPGLVVLFEQLPERHLPWDIAAAGQLEAQLAAAAWRSRCSSSSAMSCASTF